jgi:hypothetical protein
MLTGVEPQLNATIFVEKNILSYEKIPVFCCRGRPADACCVLASRRF